jgi:Tfp pilus assembly protein PilN
VEEGYAELIRVHRDRAIMVRRLAGPGNGPHHLGVLMEELLAAGGPERAAAFLGQGVPDPREAMGSAAETGLPLVPARDRELCRIPGAVAARYVGRATGPDLLPDRVHAHRRRASRRVTALFSSVAVLLLAAAAGLELWGLNRELTAVQAAREAIAPDVAQLMAVRGLTDDVLRRLDVLERVDNSRPAWSMVVADVAEHLPRDAYLTSFRVLADTLSLDGTAHDAAGAIEGLRGARRLRDVNPDAPIQRQLQIGGQHTERFSVTARLRAPQPRAEGEP